MLRYVYISYLYSQIIVIYIYTWVLLLLHIIYYIYTVCVSIWAHFEYVPCHSFFSSSHTFGRTVHGSHAPEDPVTSVPWPHLPGNSCHFATQNMAIFLQWIYPARKWWIFPQSFVCLPEGIISLTIIITIIIHYSPSINHYFHHNHIINHYYIHH